MFTITKVHITEARYSVDGKRHQSTLYYGGMVEHKGVGVFEHWGKRLKQSYLHQRVRRNPMPE